MKSNLHDQRVFPDRNQLSRAVAEAFVTSCRERVSKTGRFSLALAGGSTPGLLYELLATEFRKIPWDQIHFFWSDERYVPLDHPDSNYHMAKEALFDRVEVPSGNIHVPRTDLDDPEEAARLYEADLKRFFDSGEGGLDWVLLGLGEDGHVASLFPSSSALEEKDRWIIVVSNSPKPPPVRLTMTLPLINLSSHVHFLVSGSAKAEALRSTLESEGDPRLFPARGIRPSPGSVTWWVDEAAATP